MSASSMPHTSSTPVSPAPQAIMEADAEYAPLLVALLKRYTDNRAILLRVAFVLGNLTTNSNIYRMQVCVPLLYT